MPREAVIDQVAGILVRNEIKYMTRDDGQGYLALFGSAGVHIEFFDLKDRTAVIVRAPVLQEFELDADKRGRLLERLNEVDRDAYFGKAYLLADPLVVQAEYALPGDELQGSELMNAVYAIADTAGRLGEELVGDYGGKTFGQVWEEREGDPPVET